MSRESSNITVGVNRMYTPRGKHKAPSIDDLKVILGEPGVPLAKGSHRAVEQLWDGFFGFFDGPQIVPTNFISRRLQAPGLDIGQNWTRSFGIPGKKQMIISTWNNPRAKMLSMAAFLSKHEAKGVTPWMGAPYVDALPDEAVQEYGSAYMTSHYAGHAILARFNPDNSRGQSEARQKTLVFAGRLGLQAGSPEVSVAEVPQIIDGQIQMLTALGYDGAEESVYKSLRVANQEHLQISWDQAMQQPSAEDAAFFIQQTQLPPVDEL